jgi:hypothetical protein
MSKPTYSEVEAVYRKVLRAHELRELLAARAGHDSYGADEQQVLPVLVASQPDVTTSEAGIWLDTLGEVVSQANHPREASGLLQILHRYVLGWRAAAPRQRPKLPPPDAPSQWKRLGLECLEHFRVHGLSASDAADDLWKDWIRRAARRTAEGGLRSLVRAKPHTDFLLPKPEDVLLGPSRRPAPVLTVDF